MEFCTLTSRQQAWALDCLRADAISQAHGPITAKDELVFRTLLFTFMNRKSGACWPSLKTIAAHSNCCRRTVASAIKRLRAAGWLKYWSRRFKVGRRWTQAPNDYQLRIPRRWRRSVSECKRCARTTSSLFLKAIASGLMRDRRPKAPPPPSPSPAPLPVDNTWKLVEDGQRPSIGHNQLAAIGNDRLRAALAGLGRAISEKSHDPA